MKKNIRIEIKDERESAQDFVKAWRRAEKGMTSEQPVERIYFEDLGTLLRALTPRRMEAIKTVHDNGPMSVRALAKALGRDYKNVHKDMQEMEKIGIVVRDKEGLLLVPWQSIIAELALAHENQISKFWGATLWGLTSHSSSSSLRVRGRETPRSASDPSPVP